MVDSNIVIRDWLIAQTGITDLVSNRIYAANPLPENVTLPAISFFTRGGTSMAEVPTIVMPSVQFNCWANDPIESRKIYRALYDELNGLNNAEVTIDGTNYYILYSREEVQGQDIQDEGGQYTDIPGFWNTMSFYTVTIRNY